MATTESGSATTATSWTSTERPWMDLAIGVAVTLMLCASWIVDARLIDKVIASGAALLLAALWLVMRRSLESTGAVWVARTAAICLVGFFSVLAMPWLAIAQAILHPLCWVGAARRWQAIVASGLLCVAIVVAWTWDNPGELPAALAVEAGSFGISLWLGSWIAAIARLSNERAALIAELESTRERAAALASERGAARERDRLARDVHDTIAGDLAGVVMLIERARSTNDDPVLAHAEQAARRALTDARALVAGEIDLSVSNAGLAAALRDLASRFSASTRIEATVHTQPVRLSREHDVVLVRAAQEALTNVRKHAQAHHVTIQLAQDGQDVVLRIDDDGTGMLPVEHPSQTVAPHESSPGGFGLAAMARRAALADGVATIASSPQGGVRVEVRVPAVEWQ